ncbi:integrase catalytic domain-containing protein [Trichonephila clavata]|uniref:Integrase catalytic domain-containing protein n=1 Tax=Trichonephila clavata TaxID=2740835 RepID=A0A8X6GTQ4_TRICU|nr:integrase catalytic domain-containing protein [Trichonephila clavata]
MVKTVKEPLRRSLLSFEELTTLLAEIENIVNLRPLTYVSDDKDDPEPLTPAHFLYFGRKDFDYPMQFTEPFDKTISKETLRRRKLYQTVPLRQLWTRWKEQYLLQLRTAHKFKVPNVRENLKSGDVVLVEGTTKSKLLCQLGKTQEVLLGRDNNVRACIVKTPQGVFRRPIQILYPLEL